MRSTAAKYTAYSNDNYDEMFSTAMIAFYEAIRGYDADKGHFFPFCNSVVKRRLIDAVRRMYKSDAETVPLETDTDDGDDEVRTASLDSAAVRAYNRSSQNEDLATEIEMFKTELAQWGITLDTLVKQSPKHAKLRETYRSIADAILRNQNIIQTIILKKYLPVKRISELTGISQKKLERARTYLIATIIIKFGDYERLAEYITDGGRRS